MIHLLKFIPKIFLLSLVLLFISSCDQKKKEEAEQAPEDFTWTSSSEEALKSFETGLALQDAGDNTSSRKHLKAAIEADPNFAMAYILRAYSSGSASEFKKDTDMAVSLIENTTEGEKILIKINQSFLDNDNAGRLALHEELTSLYPNSARAWFLLAFEQDNRNETDAARKNYSKAKQLDPSWIGTYVGAGGSYLFSEPKDFDKAQSNFMKAVELSPELAFSHINLGDAYRAQNDLENALASYSKAVEINPQHLIAHSKRGHANSFLGNYDDARKDYQTSRKYNEYGNQGFDFEAYTYLYEGDVDKSLSWLEDQAMSLDASGMSKDRIKSGKLSCANSCAWIAFHHGKIDHLERLKEMRNAMNLEITNDIGTPEAIRNANANNAYWDALTAIAKGDFETAQSKAEENKSLQAESTSPNKHFSYNFLSGLINFKKGNFEAAEENFRNGSPNWIYNNYYLGKTLQALDKNEEADILLNAAAINNFNSVHYALIRNELQEGV